MTQDGGWAIQCDFDGTVSTEDVTDALLERFAEPGWRSLEARWIAGEIGSGECMRGQVALLDASAAELDAFLAGLTIDPHFTRFVTAASAMGIPLEIASDGLDYAIRRILSAHGLTDMAVRANHLVQVDERRWCLQSPHASGSCAGACGTCKCALASSVRAGSRRVLFVGDGRSDFCVAGSADFVLAKSALRDHCVRHGIAHAAFRTFEDACLRLPEIVHRSRATA